MSWVFDHVTPLSLIAGWDPRSGVVRSDNHPHLGPCQHTPLRGLGNYHIISNLQTITGTKWVEYQSLKLHLGTNISHSIHWDQSKSNLISLALNTQAKPKLEILVFHCNSIGQPFDPSHYKVLYKLPLKIQLVSTVFHSYQLEMDEKCFNTKIMGGLCLKIPRDECFG
ncbi:hypothetical protein BC833DRAFT_662587 [Globomyces pollinis-pini]|nr:hypothetical protein BC833DRAFT_662587 [Globomyces pollinis-pini]